MPEFIIRDGDVQKVGIWTGDIIEFAGVRYKITKINPKNYKLMRETDGHGFNLPKDAYGIKRSENQEWAGPKEKTPYELAMEAVNVGVTLGTVVVFTTKRLVDKYPGPYVCIGLPSDGTLKFSKLNGDRGRYVYRIKPDEVRVIEASID